MSKTALFEEHKKAGAKIVDFHAWEMPIYYTSIKEESLAVRNNVGLFDISHMGQIFIQGNESEKFVNYLISNSTLGKMYNSMVYTALCNDSGYILDDLVVYKFNENKFLMVVNASNMEKDYDWIKGRSLFFDVKVHNASDEYSMIAIQGPSSIKLLNEFFPSDVKIIKYYNFVESKFNEFPVILSRSGYTGEIGYEIIIKNEHAIILWNSLLEKKSEYQITLCGLGARDVLRVEAGFPLYGQELSERINPFETGLNWVVKFNKEVDFIGKERLKQYKENNNKDRIGFIMALNKVARENSEIYNENDEKIGYVTSGTFSFHLNQSLGMGIISKKNVAIKKIKINIGDKFYMAEIKELPFIKKINTR